MQTFRRLAGTALLLGVASTLYARQGGNSEAAVEMNCRVLEVHASASPAVVAVLFHQSDSADQYALGALLKEHSGEVVQIQLAKGRSIEGTVVRLKSCFGRGLLLLPASAPPIKERDTFVLRFAVAGN